MVIYWRNGICHQMVCSKGCLLPDVKHLICLSGKCITHTRHRASNSSNQHLYQRPGLLKDRKETFLMDKQLKNMTERHVQIVYIRKHRHSSHDGHKKEVTDCSPTDEQINTRWSIPTGQRYSASKRRTSWHVLDSWEHYTESQKGKYWIPLSTQGAQHSQICGQKVDGCQPRAEEERESGYPVSNWGCNWSSSPWTVHLNGKLCDMSVLPQ